MLSYQHGYHAGGRPDVLKHAVLHAILTELKSTERRLFYIETHSGRGVYDLTSRTAQKTGEAAQGVLAIPRTLNNAAPLLPWLDVVRSAGETHYPGSPKLALTTLGEHARFAFFERHPAEFDALQAAFDGLGDLQIKRQDGYAAALRLAPRRGERLVVFVDPSYETERDIAQLADWAPKALRRWPDACLIFWVPLFADGREQDLGAVLSDLGPSFVVAAHWPTSDDTESALTGSAVLAVNPPKKAVKTAQAIAERLEAYWTGAG